MAQSKRKRESDEFDETTNCPVCFEAFDTKKRVPRLLPCTHTTCDECTSKLMRGRSLTCPLCSKKRTLEAGAAKFPENKYIIKYLEEVKGNETTRISLFNSCPMHGREMNILCKSPGCEKDICQVCLMGPHRQHQVVDYMEEDKKFDQLYEYLLHCQYSISIAEEEVDRKCTESIETLQKVKTEYNKMCDSLMEEVNKNRTEEKEKLAEKMKRLKEQMTTYSTLQQVNANNIKTRVHTMGELEEKILNTVGDKITYLVFSNEKLNSGAEDLKQRFGIVAERSIGMTANTSSSRTEFAVPG